MGKAPPRHQGEKEEPHPCGPPPPRPGWEEGKWGTKDVHGPRSGTQRTRRHGARDPAPETSPARSRPGPSPGRAEEAAPPTLRDARGEAASQPGSLSLSGPSPAPRVGGEGQPTLQSRLTTVPGLSTRRPASAKGLGRGGGRGGEEKLTFFMAAAMSS